MAQDMQHTQHFTATKEGRACLKLRITGQTVGENLKCEVLKTER